MHPARVEQFQLEHPSRPGQVQPAPHTLTLQSLQKGTASRTGSVSPGLLSQILPGRPCFSTQGLLLCFSSSLLLDLCQNGPTSDLQNRKLSLCLWCQRTDG